MLDVEQMAFWDVSEGLKQDVATPSSVQSRSSLCQRHCNDLVLCFNAISSGPAGQDVDVQPPQEDRGGGGPGPPLPGAVLRPLR